MRRALSSRAPTDREAARTSHRHEAASSPRVAAAAALHRSSGNHGTARLLQRDRDWVGFDAERYRETGGVFSRYSSSTSAWETIAEPVTAIERELISQYFGGIVHAEAPPASIGDYVGMHVMPLAEGADKKPPYLRGLVGAWDPRRARTGHAMGSGPGRANQYGDGVYVVNPGGLPKDYQHYERTSYVYRVYAMKGAPLTHAGDEMQTVFTDPQQFVRLCFVLRRELPSVRQEMKPPEEREGPTYDPAEQKRLEADKQAGYFSLF